MGLYCGYFAFLQEDECYKVACSRFRDFGMSVTAKEVPMVDEIGNEKTDRCANSPPTKLSWDALKNVKTWLSRRVESY